MNKIVAKPYIIAEIGANHNGDMELAKQLVLEAKACGCSAVKFQLWQKDELITTQHIEELNKGIIKLENIDKWETKELGLINLEHQIRKFVMTYEQHKELFNFCRNVGIDVSSTPISNEGVDFLMELGADYMKISSMDINNLDLIKYAVKTGLPTFISTGLSTLGEIEKVVEIIPREYLSKVWFLHCISLYPPDDQIINLRFMNTIKSSFGVNVGYSDHSLGFEISLAAISLGAEVLEKHFTLDKTMPGWDHKVSANPEEMEVICSGAKRIYASLGTGIKRLTEKEKDKKGKFRRSIVLKNELKQGSIISDRDIIFKRPGTGIQIEEKKYVLGKKLKRDYEADELLKWEDLG